MIEVPLRGLKTGLGSPTVEVPAPLVQELLTLPRVGVGKRLSALGLWCAFLPIEVGQLR